MTPWGVLVAPVDVIWLSSMTTRRDVVVARMARNGAVLAGMSTILLTPANPWGIYLPPFFENMRLPARCLIPGNFSATLLLMVACSDGVAFADARDSAFRAWLSSLIG